MKHKPKLTSYDHIIKMTKRRLLQNTRAGMFPVRTGKYIPLLEDRKHAKG